MSELASVSMDGELPLKHQVLVKLHLLECKRCKSTVIQMKLIRSLAEKMNMGIPELKNGTALCPDMAQRIIELIEKKLCEEKGGNEES